MHVCVESNVTEILCEAGPEVSIAYIFDQTPVINIIIYEGPTRRGDCGGQRAGPSEIGYFLGTC